MFSSSDLFRSAIERLFYFLRKADRDGAACVYAEMPGESGIGIALRNRLFKSAAGRIMD